MVQKVKYFTIYSGKMFLVPSPITAILVHDIMVGFCIADFTAECSEGNMYHIS
jgi:hypothetical protein